MSIRQPLLFSFEDWVRDTEPDDRLAAILAEIPVAAVLAALGPAPSTGRPACDEATLIRAYVAKAVEQLPTTRKLWRRLHRDPVFRWTVGYRTRTEIPSEATFSRCFARLAATGALDAGHAAQVTVGQAAGICPTDHVAGDSADIPGWERPRRAAQATDPEAASWGLKQNAKGVKYRWFGYKLHLAVAAPTGFPLAAVTSTAKVHDSQLAIPLWGRVRARGAGQVSALWDRAYDDARVYRAVQAAGAAAIIPINRHGGQPPVGRVADGRPACSMGYAMTAVGYDPGRQVQKFRCPHATGHVDCPMGMAWCSASNYGFVVKIPINENPREVGRIVRGTPQWDRLYALRTTVERAYSYLKEQLNLRWVRVRGRTKVHAHNLLAVMALAATLLAAHRAVSA